MNILTTRQVTWIWQIPLLAVLISCNPESPAGDIGNNAQPSAVADYDALITKGTNVMFDASESVDDDGDPLTFRWTQTAGPDITNGSGELTGETITFTAPDSVSTLKFELTVSDTEDTSDPINIVVNIVENANAAYFVSGDTGNDDTGNGSPDAPFASLAKAICELTLAQQDIYLMSRSGVAVYDETLDPCPGTPGNERDASEILTVPTGTSLYGGYNAQWERDAAGNKTKIDTDHNGITFTEVDLDTWMSGIDIATDSSDTADVSVSGVSVLGGSANFYLHYNRIQAGDVGPGDATNPGTSYAVRAGLLNQIEVLNNTLIAGMGGSATDLATTYGNSASDGSNGGAGEGSSGGSGGGNGSDGKDGSGTFASGANGSSGGDGTDRGKASAGASGNSTGYTEAYEDGGVFIYYLNANGSKGSTGSRGGGGSGGNGGKGNVWLHGGGGGGGGGGGAGGAGGKAGNGGGASIGLFLADIVEANIQIENNDIQSSEGGAGGTGGIGQIGGNGGDRGDRGYKNSYYGGYGGYGGDGGQGGRGGAGGGGPSFAIALGDGVHALISNNSLSSSFGGTGGYGNTDGNGGDGGHSYTVYDFDNDANTRSILSNNTTSFGTPGDGGGTAGSAGSVGDAGSSGVQNW